MRLLFFFYFLPQSPTAGHTISTAATPLDIYLIFCAKFPKTELRRLQVTGDKDSDGFYHGESGGLSGYVPSNMVAEIPVDDEYLKHMLMQQGFLPVDHAPSGTATDFPTSLFMMG